MTNLVTRKELKVLSSPACWPRYTMTIPAGTRCKLMDNGHYVVDDVSKVIGGNAHDLAHYYIWLDSSDVVHPRFYECGICSQYHSIDWNGDCRQDDARFNPEDLDAKYGSMGWEEVPMPTWSDEKNGKDHALRKN